jgi:hypothetical protein
VQTYGRRRINAIHYLEIRKTRHGKSRDNNGKILRGTSDTNIEFYDVRGILLHIGFVERIRGEVTTFFERKGLRKR